MAVLDEIVVVLLFVLFLSPNASGRKVGASTPRFFAVGAIAPPPLGGLASKEDAVFHRRSGRGSRRPLLGR